MAGARGTRAYPVFKQEWPFRILANTARWMGDATARGEQRRPPGRQANPCPSDKIFLG
jgi:hypothetical protein